MHQANLLYIFWYVFRVAWNQHDYYTWATPQRQQWQKVIMRMRIVCVCSRIRYYIRLTHKQIVVLRNWLYAKFVNWCDCLNAGCCRGPAKESRRGTSLWHVTRQRWLLECLNERPESKELWLIYLQVILVARISKQYLLLHVGNWHIHSQNLIESFLVLTREILLMYVDVIWKHCSNRRNGWKGKASHCIGIGTWCTWI